MRFLKRYSAQYQTVEIEQELDNLGQVETITNAMDEIAKKELEKMIKLKGDLEPAQETVKVQPSNNYSKPNNYNNKAYNYNKGNSSSTGPSDKQIKYMLDDFEKTKSLASGLGLTINSPDDLKTLSKKDATQLLGLIFNK